MPTNVCAIYDVNDKYAYKLMNAINAKKNITFKTLVFTQKDLLMESLAKEKIDILIISEKAVNDEIKKSKLEKLIILTEDMISSNEKESQDYKYQNIFKYQSADTICREVMEYCCTPLVGTNASAKIIGVYSPVNYAYKTTFCLAYANEKAKEKKVLFINLEEYSGLSVVFGRNEVGNLSDAFYNYKVSGETFLDRISDVTMKVGRFDYIPSAECAEDITFVTVEEWIEFINAIAESDLYDEIVLDISNAIKEQWKILNICERVYMPIRDDSISIRRINDFEKYFLMEQNEKILDKIEKITVPYDETISFKPDLLERIEYSNMGRWVSDLVYAE